MYPKQYAFRNNFSPENSQRILRATDMKTFITLCLWSVIMINNATAQKTGLAIKNEGTHLAYLAYNDKPLLAFGPHFEHMFFDDYDVEAWTEWAVQHGMNHCRYPTLPCLLPRLFTLCQNRRRAL